MGGAVAALMALEHPDLVRTLTLVEPGLIALIVTDPESKTIVARRSEVLEYHFRVAPGRCAEFETGWHDRESYLHDVPGFESFHLLRGPEEDGARLYASHTVWDA